MSLFTFFVFLYIIIQNKKLNIMRSVLSNNFNSAIEQILPALSGSNVTYNKERNIFLSDGYTSAAGNTYFQGIRLSDRIIINYDFGQGYAWLFLNGIRIYGYDGRDKRLIASRSYYSCGFNESFAKNECVEMIKEYLVSQMKMVNAPINENQLDNFSNCLIASTLNPSNLLK